MLANEKRLNLKGFFTIAEIPGYLFLAEPMVSYFTLRSRDAEAYTTIDTSALIQIIYVLICFITAFYFLFLSPKDKPTLLLKSPQIYLLA